MSDVDMAWLLDQLLEEVTGLKLVALATQKVLAEDPDFQKRFLTALDQVRSQEQKQSGAALIRAKRLIDNLRMGVK